MMNEEIFDRVGKRMPYRAPEGYSGELESRVMAQVAALQDSGLAQTAVLESRRKNRLRIAACTMVAAAAAAALFVVMRVERPADTAGGYAQVAAAFDNLSADDQAFMLEASADDAFMYAYQ